MSSTVEKSVITLKGSAEILCDYLNYGINSILYQRGLYPPENFKTAENYGLSMVMMTDKKIIEFLENSLGQTKEWLAKRMVKKIALIIINVKTSEVLEQWDFKVEYEGSELNSSKEQTSDKPLKQIQSEIRDVVRQITSSVTFLPLLDCLCSFDIQIYTIDNVSPPKEWSETNAATIHNAQTLTMKSFSTNIHKMETAVTYKNVD